MGSYQAKVANITTGVPLIIEAFTTGKLGDMNAVSITSIATVLTPTTGTIARILGFTFSVSADASVLFEDNAAGTTVFRSPLLLAKTPYTVSLGYGYKLAAVNNVLKATSSAAASITGMIWYDEENA